MSNVFALIANSGATLRIMNGSSGDILHEEPLPDSLGANYYCDVSYDGKIIAVTAWAKGYVWFYNQETSTSTSVPSAGFVGTGHGFDGDNVFNLGGNQQYMRIAPPYVAGSIIGTPGQVVTIAPNQQPAKSSAVIRDPNTGEQTFHKFNLLTGGIGDVFGVQASGTPTFTETGSKYILAWLPLQYGVRVYEYDSLAFNDVIGPRGGAGGGQTNKGFALTSDGTQFVIKSTDNQLSVGIFGSPGSARQVNLDSVADYSADNSYVSVEGMLDDTHVLLSSSAIQNMLVSFNILTGAVAWANSNGAQPNTSAQDLRYVAVQPTTGPGSTPIPPVPVDPTAFWTNVVQSYETVS
jgi:hypothetical protein